MLIHSRDFDEATGKIVLVYSLAIEDEYGEHCTIRKVEITDKKVKGKFGEKRINLTSLNPENEAIVIDNVTSIKN